MSATNSDDTVFIAGNFNVLHAGHIRLFAFARNFGKKLVVGVMSDSQAGRAAYVEQSLRLEAVRTNNWVSKAILIDEPIEAVLRRLKPKSVIKGREFEQLNNIESSILLEWGGRVIFGSSELPLSSVDMMRRELATEWAQFRLPELYLNSHNITGNALRDTVTNFRGLHVCVVGDLIIDEYISCESLGMSQEDPSLVVTPLDKRRFLGGAGIVAAHAAGLGATASLITVTGNDSCGEFAKRMLDKYEVSGFPVIDDSRPTTLKQRFRADGKTLLRVSHLAQSSISPTLQEAVYDQYISCIQKADLVVFSDFNYGCLPNKLIDRLITAAAEREIICVADSQCSSQVGDVSRFKDMSLISATEREVRISLRDNDDGLTVIAERLRTKAKAKHVMMKLGSDGVLVHTKGPDGRTMTSQFPALNHSPVDVAGAGDSMLIAAGLTLATGASLWEATVIGSVASALQVAKLGNQPISQSEFLGALHSVK